MVVLFPPSPQRLYCRDQHRPEVVAERCQAREPSGPPSLSDALPADPRGLCLQSFCFSSWPSPLLLPACSETSQTNCLSSWLLFAFSSQLLPGKIFYLKFSREGILWFHFHPPPPTLAMSKSTGQVCLGCPESSQAKIPLPQQLICQNQMVGWKNEVATRILC